MATEPGIRQVLERVEHPLPVTVDRRLVQQNKHVPEQGGTEQKAVKLAQRPLGSEADIGTGYFSADMTRRE